MVNNSTFKCLKKIIKNFNEFNFYELLKYYLNNS